MKTHNHTQRSARGALSFEKFSKMSSPDSPGDNPDSADSPFEEKIAWNFILSPMV